MILRPPSLLVVAGVKTSSGLDTRGVGVGKGLSSLEGGEVCDIGEMEGRWEVGDGTAPEILAWRVSCGRCGSTGGVVYARRV
jgi:hypothetical protein